MDVARCLCPLNLQACPFHGESPADPIKPYRLSENDRQVLKAMRIASLDSADIQQLRQADEDRFKRE